MKLVEILARELQQWPGAIEAIVQRSTGVIYLYGTNDPIFLCPLADDWALAIVTIGEWKAERARILFESQPKRDREISAIVEKACGKRSKEDQALWDKVAIALYIERIKLNSPHDGDVDFFECAFSGADAFMAERAKRMKG